jgi:hypothetical protein
MLIGVFFIIVTFFVSGKLTSTQSKTDAIGAREILKRIQEESENYYDSYQHYGFIANADYQRKSCDESGTVFGTPKNLEYFTKNVLSSKCIFTGNEGRVDEWAAYIEAKDGKWCADSAGKIKKVAEFADNRECE